jgi:hypothetical protein
MLHFEIYFSLLSDPTSTALPLTLLGANFSRQGWRIYLDFFPTVS